MRDFHHAGTIAHLEKVTGFTGPLAERTARYRTILDRDESTILYHLCLHLGLITLGSTLRLVDLLNAKAGSDDVYCDSCNVRFIRMISAGGTIIWGDPHHDITSLGTRHRT
jgi:hypothetical protein